MLDLVPILRDLREEFAASVPLQTAAPPNPVNISPWLAKALLQKACRRGETEWALRAAATLFLAAPDALWKRVACIAFEDVGLANLDAVISVCAALASKRYRSTLGGEWQVASHLVQLLANSAKCRATDDLLLVAEQHPASAEARQRLPELSLPELLSAALNPLNSLPDRAAALWFAIGTDRRPSPKLVRYKGHPDEVFRALFDAGVPATLVAVAQQGFVTLSEVLCPFLALLSLEPSWKNGTTADDPIAPAELAGGIPAWAIDLYSREGRRALAAFLDLRCPTSEWVRSRIPAYQQNDFVGTLLFRIEGGLMRRRLQWSTGLSLKRQVDLGCFPLVNDASSLLEMMRADLPLLNKVRCDVLR